MDNKDKKAKEERKDRIRAIKGYSQVINMFLSFISTMIVGVVLGFFFNKWFAGDNWILICTLAFFLIAIVNFYRQLLKIR